MREGKRKVLLVSSQPIQNAATLRLMEAHPDFEVLTAYCSLLDAKLWRDDEHLNKEVFDTPLNGYNWVRLANWSPLPQLGKFYGLINPGVVRRALSSDCVVVFGHSYISFWLAIAAAKLSGKPLILTTDATHLELADKSSWKTKIKKRLLPFLYNHVADTVLVPSSASQRFMCSLGINDQRIALTPYVVDNDYIESVAARTDRSGVRAEWQIPNASRVIAFCAKFLPRKRPHDALRAFASAGVADSYLLMIGDGPLLASLRQEAAQLGVADRVRFAGLVKYSRLPELYAASDLLVFTSEREPYGLPVNEAMICGLPVIASDKVGAASDLIREGETGFTYPCGDVDKLAGLIRDALSDDERLRQMGQAAQRRMQTWSPRENAEATLDAIEKAIASNAGPAMRIASERN